MNTHNNNDKTSENDTSKGMNTKNEVSESPDPKTDQDFPGYPHYPAKEGDMDQEKENKKVDTDVEPSGTNESGLNQRFEKEGNQHNDSGKNQIGGESNNNLENTDSTNEEIGTPQNVTNEDLNSNKISGSNNGDVHK